MSASDEEMSASDDSQPSNTPLIEFTFVLWHGIPAARTERLSQEDLNRFPDSMLHNAVEDAGDVDSGVPVRLPSDGPQGRLVPMIFDVYRGANLGEALLTAFCANPAAFASDELCLEDIEKSLDYFKLPPSFLRDNLEHIISEVTDFCEGDHNRPESGEEEGSLLDDVLSFSPALPGLYRLVTSASARCVAYNVLHALKKECPSNPWHVACGSAFFIVLAPNSRSQHLLAEEEEEEEEETPPSFPSCLMLSAKVDSTSTADAKECRKFMAALSHARSGRPPSKRIQCLASCKDWNGQVHGTEALRASGDDELCISSLDPALYPALCHNALPQEMQKLGLSISWFQCMLTVFDEQAWNGGEGDEEVIMEGPMHIMAVSWA